LSIVQSFLALRGAIKPPALFCRDRLKANTNRAGLFSDVVLWRLAHRTRKGCLGTVWGQLSQARSGHDLLQCLGLFIEEVFAGGLAAGLFPFIVFLCPVLLLELARYHSLTGRPYGVLLHLFPEYGHFVFGQYLPRCPFAAGFGVGRWRGKLGESVAGRDAGDGAVYVGA
jgi:hypothetical protein